MSFHATSSALALSLTLLAVPAAAQTTAPQTSATTTPDAPPEAQTPSSTVPTSSSTSASGATPGIVVTGIRASLRSAAAIKRNSPIVVDSITQEDLGKFPDANVAESLQRIPGVAIDRNNGEGQFVTVRGLGPQFNTVLFNGRSFASDNYSRAFSFDLLPAELITGADVYKTSQAHVQDGGIGATINLHTARPFDIDGFRAIGTLKGNYEQNNHIVTPQAFGLVSQTFADGKVGLLASLSYQKRIAQINSVTSDGWLPLVSVGPAAAPYATNVYAPRNVNVNSSRDDRTRLGATLVGQFRPTDTLVVTVDGLYDHFKSDQTNNSLGLWFEPSAYTKPPTLDANRTVTALSTTGSADMINSSGVRDTTTWEVGLNADWKPTDTLHVVLDATRSSASNNGAGRSFFTVAGIPTAYSFMLGGPGQLPSVGGFTADIANPNLLGSHLAQRSGNNVSEKVHEVRLNTEWKADSGALKVVRFGGSYTERARMNQGAGTLNASCLYCGYQVPADPSLFSPISVGSIGSGGSVPTTFLRYDPNAYLAYLANPATLSRRDTILGLAPGTSAALLSSESNGAGFAAVFNPADRVREQVYAAYAEMDLEGTLGGLDWFVNLGARYIHTSLDAFSSQRALVDLLPVPNDASIYNPVFQNNGAYVPVNAKNTYDKLLPDMNVRIKLARNVNLRLAASQTLTRPDLNDLRPITSYDVTRPAAMQASGGNPDLKPYRATNLDVSLEWYPTPITTLSVAGFYKNIDDFIVTTIENETVSFRNSGNIPVGGFITGPNTVVFATARPRNAGSAIVRGVELNATTSFDFLPGFLSGFGTSLNATFVGTNRTFADIDPNVRFAVVGLGNTQNATLFYEKYGISARIAYNRRERFLQSIANGYGSEPLFVRTYGQVDGQASYNINKHIQVFVEGTNIFNAKYVTVARYANQLRSYFNYGSRYDAGVRLSF